MVELDIQYEVSTRVRLSVQAIPTLKTERLRHFQHLQHLNTVVNPQVRARPLRFEMHLYLNKDVAIDLVTDLQWQFTENAERCLRTLMREGDVNCFDPCNIRRASGLEQRGGCIVHGCSIFGDVVGRTKLVILRNIIKGRQLTKSLCGT